MKEINMKELLKDEDVVIDSFLSRAHIVSIFAKVMLTLCSLINFRAFYRS